MSFGAPDVPPAPKPAPPVPVPQINDPSLVQVNSDQAAIARARQGYQASLLTPGGYLGTSTSQPGQTQTSSILGSGGGSANG